MQAAITRGFSAVARSDVDLNVLVYEPDTEVWMHGMDGVGVGGCFRGRDGVRALYGEIDSQRVPPCCLYAAENGAVGVTELLIRDAGFHPVTAGGLGSARMLEDHLGLMTAINEGGLGRFFYRYAMPGEL